MKQLSACLRKEWLELIRTRKIFYYVFFPVAAVLLSVLVVSASEFMRGQLPEEEQVLFPSFAHLEGLLSLCVSFLLSYYVIVTMLVQMGSSSREIRKKQWIVPLNAGISRKNLVLSKLIVLPLVAMIPAWIGIYVSVLIGGLVYGNATGMTVVELLRIGLCAAITIYVSSVATVSISAITETTWLTGVLCVGCYLFGDLVLSVLESAVLYTPFLFQTIALGSPGLAVTPAQWIIATLVTIFLLGILVYAALFRRDRRVYRGGFRK